MNNNIICVYLRKSASKIFQVRPKGANSKIFCHKKQLMQRPVNKQKKAGEVLNPVDDDIEKESNYKEQLKSLKKGLLQVLLTGKIRVTV
ncbi:MAG: hypothetical protein J7K15_08890 [Deltaproteobacteria bacterium]|nr:hypothetical protein [Deltaproteobacteria bacterium]